MLMVWNIKILCGNSLVSTLIPTLNFPMHANAKLIGYHVTDFSRNLDVGKLTGISLLFFPRASAILCCFFSLLLVNSAKAFSSWWAFRIKTRNKMGLDF